jgi:DNA-binding beta-propeller fold protein YncE
MWPVLRSRTGLAVLVIAVMAAAAGCSSPTPAAIPTKTPVPGNPTAARTDVPEPATAPPTAATPAGRVVSLPGNPEGLAVDPADGIVAAGIRSPEGVALLDAATGRQRKVVRLPGAPRHLDLATPAGPLLVPMEDANRLAQVSLPDGAVIADTPVGHQPHDAAAVGSVIFVGNEYSNTVSLIKGGRQVSVEAAPRQPGGVAADRSFVLAVGVRGRQVEAYSASGKVLGTATAGVGPTHVQAGPGGAFYVADTEGDAVLDYWVTSHGVRQLATVRTKHGAPYGMAVDLRRNLLYVTLTATNLLESFRITGGLLLPDQTWPTVRQPDSVAVDENTGRVYVASRTDSQLEMIDPGSHGTPVSLLPPSPSASPSR